jgi:anti-sigma B factor antagonist
VSGEGCPVLWIGRVAVVTLPDEVDVTNAGAIGEDLLSALNQGAVLLVADMSKTTFCDSAGVSALVATFRQAVRCSSGLRLVVGTPAVRRVLSLTGVDRLMEMFPSVAACLAGPYGVVPQDSRSGEPESATAKADTDGGGAGG